MQELLVLELEALLDIVDLVGVESICPRRIPRGSRVHFHLAVNALGALRSLVFVTHEDLGGDPRMMGYMDVMLGLRHNLPTISQVRLNLFSL